MEREAVAYRFPLGQVSIGMLMTTPGRLTMTSPLASASLTAAANFKTRADRASFQVTRFSARSGL